VLTTHGHPDHIGLAASLQRAGADVWVHEADAPILADGPRSAFRHAPPEAAMLRYLVRRPAAVAAPLHLARAGAFTAPRTATVHTIATAGRLDAIPGRPRVVSVPGHTDGSVAYLFEDLGVLFTGDALVTYDGLTGHVGPTVVCRGFTHDGAAALAALDELEKLDADLILPGHGDPFAGPPAHATRLARAAGLR